MNRAKHGLPVHPARELSLFGLLVFLVITVLVTACVTSTSFQEWRGPDEFVGRGGLCRTVDGIDIWENGSPYRRCKILGVIDRKVISKAIFLAASGGHSPQLDARLAKEAKKHGGDAVILIDADSHLFSTSHSQSRPYAARDERFLVVRYLETEPEDLLGKEDYQDTFGKGHYALKEETPAEQIHANCDLEIRELLVAGEDVALCINITEPSISCGLSPDAIQNWQKAITDEVGNFYENVVFSYYNKFENFTLVDRNNLTNVLKEHQLSQLELTNKETRIQVGKLVGINYLVKIGYNRYCSLPRMNDITTIKLIEIETGKIMAVDTIENRKIYNPKSLQYQVIKTVLNGQEVVVGPDGRTLYRKQSQ
jgi:hypothetical protein